MSEIALIFLLYAQDTYKWNPEAAGAPLLSKVCTCTSSMLPTAVPPETVMTYQ